MPCWYYEKIELQSTPSIKDGISPETETRYRKEGARFIIDAGNTMGLKYNTCATGVVYFHRFYMFHSFAKFPRWVTAACCLFLAGKAEETPKKCRDLIKTAKDMLSESQMAAFKDDPKEEIMTMERILLQTIKFDLMVEHPYDYLIKFGKLIKADNEKDKIKVQNLVQMSWTFINDSLCTTLCVQWEPDVIAVAIMYLVCRVNKFEITNWVDKPAGYRGKWYEFFVDDVTLDLLEDICHQVLDLYSEKQTTSPVSNAKKSIPNLAGDFKGVADNDTKNVSPTTPQPSSSKQHNQPVSQSWQGANVPVVSTHPQQFSHANPYVSTGMYSSSFLNREGSQNIQSLINNEDSAKVAGLQFQQQPCQHAPLQYSYQQPTTASGTPTLTQLPQTQATVQGFPPSAGNDGSFIFQNVGIQGKAPYQNTSAATQSNHHWK